MGFGGLKLRLRLKLVEVGEKREKRERKGKRQSLLLLGGKKKMMMMKGIERVRIIQVTAW